MKLLLDVIYALLENTIYVMYLDLFFKDKRQIRYNKIFFIIMMSLLSLIMNKYIVINYSGVILLIVSFIYVQHFYHGDIYNKLIKIVFININMLLINLINHLTHLLI